MINDKLKMTMISGVFLCLVLYLYWRTTSGPLGGGEADQEDEQEQPLHAHHEQRKSRAGGI